MFVVVTYGTLTVDTNCFVKLVTIWLFAQYDVKNISLAWFLFGHSFTALLKVNILYLTFLQYTHAQYSQCVFESSRTFLCLRKANFPRIIQVKPVKTEQQGDLKFCSVWRGVRFCQGSLLNRKSDIFCVKCLIKFCWLV